MGKLKMLIGSLFEKKNNNVITEKNLIREKIRKKKQQITDKEKEIEASNVFEKIEALPEFENGGLHPLRPTESVQPVRLAT